MTRKQRIQPVLASATLAAILLTAMHAFAASAEPESASRPSASTADVDAIPTTSPDATTHRSPRRLSSHQFRHSLRMPFFSFQPLG